VTQKYRTRSNGRRWPIRRSLDEIEPKPRDTESSLQVASGQNVDRVFVPSVEKGVMKACEEGILAGYRVVDVKIDFYDGKMHPVDSKDIAFQIAGYFGSRKHSTWLGRACRTDH